MHLRILHRNICTHFMKKNTLSLFLLAIVFVGSLLATQSCNKGTTNSTEKKVSLVHANMIVDIPLLPGNGDYDSITSFYYKMNMDSFVKSYGQDYDTSSIRSVKLNSCIITLSGVDTLDNFRNFHTTNIGLTSGTNRNLFRIAAFTDIVDTNAYFINIPKSYNPNLATYYKADSVRYRLYGNLRRATTKEIVATANISLDVVLSK